MKNLKRSSKRTARLTSSLLRLVMGSIRVVMLVVTPRATTALFQVALEVYHPPSGMTPHHRHEGTTAVAYVLEGEFLSGMNGNPPKVYRAVILLPTIL